MATEEEQVKNAAKILNSDSEHAISTFLDLEEQHIKTNETTEAAILEMERLTGKNNKRKLRFHKAKLITSGASVGVVSASGGTTILGVGGLMLVGSTNRWIRENKYMNKINRILENIREVLQAEIALVKEYLDPLIQVDDSHKQLCEAVGRFDDDIALQSLLGSLVLTCPLLYFYIRKAAPEALGQAAIYAIREHPETTFDAVVATLPAIIHTFEFFGIENTTNFLLAGFEALPFIGAAAGFAFSAAQLSSAKREVNEGLEEIITPIRNVLEERKESLEKLRNLLPGHDCDRGSFDIFGSMNGERYDCIPPGTHVSLKGLVSRPDHDGDLGVVQQYDPQDARYIVKLEDTDKTMSVKASNLLQHVHVKVQNLQSKPELNGKDGTVMAWNPKTERYNIYIMDLENIVSLKPSNVILDNGTVGSITGLVSKPELNGTWGTIKEWVQGTNKYDVQLSADKIIRIKADNIRV
jgi:hypothetical protein